MHKSVRPLAALALVILIAIVVWYIYDSFVRQRTTAERLADVVLAEDSRRLTNPLRRAVSDSLPEVRAKAAMALGRIGGKEAAGLLNSMIEDSSLDVSAAACFALGLTGEKQYAQLLLDRAFDLPSQAARQAVASIGRLADSSMTGITSHLPDFLAHPSPDVRAEACYAMFRAGAGSQAEKLIGYARREQDEAARTAAIYALARLGIKEARELYIDNLADPDPFVRQCCLRGLGADDSKEALRAMAIALNDGDQNVVIEAITRLGQSEKSRAEDHLLGKLPRVEGDPLRVTMLRAFRQRESKAALPWMQDLLIDEPSPWLVAAAVQYAAAVQGDRAVPLLDSVSRSDDALIRAACAEAYGLIDHENMIGRLAVFFADEDPRVRAAAFGGLVKIDDQNASFYIGQALDDADRVLNGIAVDQIAGDTLTSFLPQLLSLSQQADSLHIDVRRSLVAASAAFLTKDPSDSTALTLLVNGALDRDYLVRREAAEVYREVLGEDRLDLVPPAIPRYSHRQLVRAFEKYRVNPAAILATNRGEIEIELLFDVAPLTVLNFVDLAASGFYDELTFHRVVPSFVVQGGCDRGDGWGGPDWNIRCEYSSEPYHRGAVGIATSGPDSGGSQFFITLSPQPHLEARYTVFGRVMTGMDVADRLIPGDTIKQITIHQE